MSDERVKNMSPVSSEDITKSSVEEQLQTAKDLVANIKSMGANVEAAEAIIAQAEKAFEEDNLEIAKSLLDSAVKTSTLIKQQYFVQASSILFSSLQRSIVSLEGSGSEVNYIKDLYNKAKERFDKGQYEEAMDYIKSAEDMVHELKGDVMPPHGALGTGEEGVEDELTFEYEGSQEQMENVSKVLIRVERLLQEAIEGGYSVNEAEKLYSLAEDAFDYQDYKKAEEYAMQSEHTLEEILRPMRTEGQKVEADTEEKSPGEALGKMREDLPRGDSFTSRMPDYSELMPKGILGDLSKKPEDESMFEEEPLDPELELEKHATNLLISADEKIAAAKEAGLNMPMAERLLTIGESYFDRGEFERVKEYAEKAIKQVDEIITRKGYQEQVEANLNKGREQPELELAEEEPEIELPPLKFQMPSDESVSEVAEEDTEEEVELEEMGTKKISPKKLKSELAKLKSEILETKETGVNVDAAEELITNAIDEFKEHNYEEANANLKKAKGRIRTIKIKFIKKKALEMIKYAWKEIEKAEIQGIDIAEANSLLQNSRNQIKIGEFEKAVELALQSLQLIKAEME